MPHGKPAPWFLDAVMFGAFLVEDNGEAYDVGCDLIDGTRTDERCSVMWPWVC